MQLSILFPKINNRDACSLTVHLLILRFHPLNFAICLNEIAGLKNMLLKPGNIKT